MINNCVGDSALQGFDVEDFSHTVCLDGGGRIEPLDLSDDSNNLVKPRSCVMWLHQIA